MISPLVSLRLDDAAQHTLPKMGFQIVSQFTREMESRESGPFMDSGERITVFFCRTTALHTVDSPSTTPGNTAPQR